MPSKQEALDLSVILHSADNKLRQPVGLEQQLLQHLSMDEEVGQSMVQLLQVIDIAHYSMAHVYSMLHTSFQTPSLSDAFCLSSTLGSLLYHLSMRLSANSCVIF